MARCLFLLILLCSLTFFVGLDRVPITDSDEAFYAEGAREMIETRDWLTPHFNYQPRFEKPVLYYWLAASSYLVFGVSEIAARFPSALAGLALALLTFVCGCRWYDKATGLLAGTIIATNFGYLAITHQALPDLPLAFFITLATWAGLNFFSDSPTHKALAFLDRIVTVRRQWLLLSTLALAAAFLTKGPIGIVLPFIVIVSVRICLLWSRRKSQGPRISFLEPLTLIDCALAGLVFAVVATPWYLAVTAVHGTEYLTSFFIGENIQRFATNKFNDPRPFWFYLPIVFGGIFPWSPFVFLWIRPAIQFLRLPYSPQLIHIQLLCWTFVPLLFFTISVGKQPRYILPILPPLAILLAKTIRSRLREHSTSTNSAKIRRDKLFASLGLVSGCVFLFLGLFVSRLQISLLDWDTDRIFTVGTVIVVSGVFICISTLSKRQYLLVWSLAAAAIATQLAVQCFLLPSLASRSVEQVAQLLIKERNQNEPSGRYRIFNRNLVFYSKIQQTDLVTDEQVLTFLNSNQRVLCVITEDDLQRIEAEGLHIHRLGTISYFNTGNLKLSTLLFPNPNRDLKNVTLIANR